MIRNVTSKTPPKSVPGLNDENSTEKTKNAMHSIKKSAVEMDVSNESNNFFLKDLKKISYESFLILMSRLKIFLKETGKLLWKFLELHIAKLILLSFVLLAAYNVCFIHTAFIAFAIIAVIYGKTIQIIIIHTCSTLSSLLLLSGMVYQIGYFEYENWETNCSGLSSPNSEIELFREDDRFNNAAWIGFQKDSYLLNILGYMGIVLICTFYAVVRTRQKVHGNLGLCSTVPAVKKHSCSYFPYLEKDVLFPGVDRENADTGIIPCIKFFFNYGFYKFGVEICLTTTAIVIGVHMDAYSIIYSIWLCFLVCLSCHIERGPKGNGYKKWRGGRHAVAGVWIYFLFTTAILLLLQYLIAVGFPPFMCIDFQPYESEWLKRLYEWMPLPNNVNSLSMVYIVYDFILLILVSNQKKVFYMERIPNYKYPGGCNRDTFLDQLEENPVQDFTSNVVSWLDVVKRVVFFSSFWISLAIVFLAGTNQVNVFSLGYLVGCFIFLWQGNDFFLHPIIIIFNWWNKLIGYNVCVILCRSLMQVLGCVFTIYLPLSTCWVIQLLGITCSNRFRYQASGCDVPETSSNLAWDVLCLTFLLLQRRIFGSHYFIHVINETKVQALLASRGAELMEELNSQQMMEQEDLEHQKLMKIKQKMQAIKVYSESKQSSFFRKRANHYDAMLSGDYYMFEELHHKENEDIHLGISESLKSTEDGESIKTDDHASKCHKRKFTLTQLITSAVKNSIEQTIKRTSIPEKDFLEVDLIGKTKLDVEKAANEQNNFKKHQDESSASVDTSVSVARLQISDYVDEGSKQCNSDIIRTSSQKGQDPSKSEKEKSIAHEKSLEQSSSSFKDGVPQGGLYGRGNEPSNEDVSDTADNEGARKIKAGFKFIWILIESLMIAFTIWLNQFSENYRYVASCLAREKDFLKRKAVFQADTSKKSTVPEGPSPVSSKAW